MNTTKRTNNSEVRAEQVTNEQYDTIFLGIDLHKKTISITRVIDHSTPQPSQLFTWDRLWPFVEKQTKLAKKVYAVYEAGAFGFWVCRRFKAMGVECFITHPEKLDQRHKRVQTDRLDSRELADKLVRYVRGNKKAMVAVYVPSEEEEQKRIEARHRRRLSQELRSLQASGRGLLLSQGIFDTQRWWEESRLQALKSKISPELAEALEDCRALIEAAEKRLRVGEKKLKASAPTNLPAGFGALTYVLLAREICNFHRFKNRRNPGGFTGLGGAVSSSGPYHVDLGITKAGNAYVRTLLVELAWRMVYWQPGYTGLKVWKRLEKAGELRTQRRRKIAIVAVARQLAVDIWRWQTGRVTPEQLGWKLNSGKQED